MTTWLAQLPGSLPMRYRQAPEASAAAAKGESWQEGSILLTILGRCHEDYRERRERVREYGAQVIAKSRAEEQGAEDSVRTEQGKADDSERSDTRYFEAAEGAA